MMNLLIRHNGQEYGPYSLEEVSTYLGAGSFQMSDLARREGTTDWQPLSAITGLLGSVPPPLPPHQPPPLPQPAFPSFPQPRTSGLSNALLICGGVGFAILAVAILAGIMVPVIFSQRKKAARSAALANARNVGMALDNFEKDYGSYPSAATVKEIQFNQPDSSLTFGYEYSNDYFRQLIAAGYVDSEEFFYARTPYTRKPDNDIKGARCLAAGEVGFGYIMASASEALSSQANPECPIIVTPLLNAAADGTFDPFDFDRKAVVLRIDNSVWVESIRPSDKKVLIGGGKTLFQSGEGTVWGDIKPVIRTPLKSENSTR